MKRNNILKIFSVLLAFLPFFYGLSNPLVISANSNLSIDEQKVVLAQKLKQIDKRLDYLSKNSNKTQDYLNTLDSKLLCLKEQYNLILSDCNRIQADINDTHNNLEQNKNAVEKAKIEIKNLDLKLDDLNNYFLKTYGKYKKRLRAMYISEEKDTYLMFLLDSSSIENFLIRLEMFRRVTRQDSELISNINHQMDNIISTRANIKNESEKLNKNRAELENNENKLKNQRAKLFNSEEKLKAQKQYIENEQKRANEILKKLNDKTQMYGEYRDVTVEELAQIDSDIAVGDEKYQDDSTQLETTTKPNENDTTTSKLQENLNFTYPCPSYTQITCGFGEYKGHSGCDFSTRSHENQKIVAAESGRVILVKLLEKSYGHYLVIRHDKKTADGQIAYTLYAHNNDIIVKEGDYVKKGQQIAYSGTTGNSTGPHCHFEIRIGGSSQAYAKDPSKYLKNGSG